MTLFRMMHHHPLLKKHNGREAILPVPKMVVPHNCHVVVAPPIGVGLGLDRKKVAEKVPGMAVSVHITPGPGQRVQDKKSVLLVLNLTNLRITHRHQVP